VRFTASRPVIPWTMKVKSSDRRTLMCPSP
jgi:hypothetical protein